jgi:VCBS repeat protein
MHRSLARGTTAMIASVMFMVALAAPASAISPSFDPAHGLDLAGQANAVAVGDFDGDGIEDLAGAYGDVAGAVSVWRGTGDPAAAFAHQAPDVAVGVSPQALLARDLNGDGRDDLVVANRGPAFDGGDDYVSILLGGPSGLVAGETLTVRDAPIAIDAGDLDGDGDQDVVVGNFGSGNAGDPSMHVSVLTGNGAGHFDVANHAVGCQVAGVAIADLVAGGGVEVGVGCISGPAVVKIFAADAGGALHQVGADHPACDSNPTDVAAGNFDGLGAADLAVVCLEPEFAVLGSDAGFAPLPGPNQPEQVFEAVSPSGNAGLLHVEVSDVNSDGFDDVLAADVTNNRAIVADGRGNSRFLPETGSAGSIRVGTAFPLGIGLADVTAADVNEDGKPDLVAAVGNQIVIRYATTPVPGVRTGSASSVGHDAATVGAVVNPSGTATANETTYRFEYGTTRSYGRTTAALPEGRSLGGDAYVSVSGVLGGLAPETVYHYRVVASNGHGTTYGRDRAFRTGATPPPPPATAAVDTAAPGLTLSLSRTVKRAKLLKRGLRVAVVTDEPSTLRVELLGSAGKVRLARVGDVVLADRRLPLGADRRSVTLKLPQRFRRGLRSRFGLTLRVTAVDAAGNQTVATRRVSVR